MPPQVFMNYIHPSSMLKQLACLWNQGQLCDAVITVDNCIVAKAHRLVLFAASPKLKAQAESSADGINSAVLQVKLPSMLSQKSIDIFLHYLYEGYLMLTESVIHDIVKIADHLDLKCLYKCCVEYCRQNQVDISQPASSTNSQAEDYRHVRLMNVDLKVEDLEPKSNKSVTQTSASKEDSNHRDSSENIPGAASGQSSDMNTSKTHEDTSYQKFPTIKQTSQKSHSEQSEVINLDSDDDEDDIGGGGDDFSSSSQSNINKQSSFQKPSTSNFSNNSQQTRSPFHGDPRKNRVIPKAEISRAPCSENVSSNYTITSSRDTAGSFIKTEPNMSPSCSLNTSQSSMNTDFTVTLNSSNFDYPIETEVDIKPILENLEQYEENTAMSNEQMLSNQMTSSYYSEASSHSMGSADQQQVYMDQQSEGYGGDMSLMQGFENQTAGSTDETNYAHPERTYSCRICATTFFDKNAYQRHNAFLHGSKSFVCNVCNKGYVSKKALVEHSNIHRPDNAIICGVCNKKFSSKKMLSTHLMIHSAVSKFKCPICNEAFKRKDYLRSHMVTHSNTRPFVCDICGVAFKRTVNLNTHKALRHSRSNIVDETIKQ